MPAGVSWSQYLKFMTCATLAMMAGSQAVHLYYKPLDNLDVYIEKERQHPHDIVGDTRQEESKLKQV